MINSSEASRGLAGLPYDPRVARLLVPLRRAFRIVNRRLTGPATQAGFGPLLSNPVTGSILVLRTTGRKSGLVREAPLGYAIVDGAVIVVAGYGRTSHWFRNALAHPEVEVVLPGAVVAGRAAELTEPVARRRAFRAAIAAMGTIGRLTVGDVATMDDDQVDRLVDGFPVLAITVTGLRPGPFDPDGQFWRVPAVASAVGSAGLVLALRHAVRARRARRDRERRPG